MFGRSLFGQMEQDPFFTESRDHFHQMNQMFQSPFGSGMGMLEDGRGHTQDRRRGGERREDHGELAPFGNFGFGGFGQMFSNMDRMMQDSQRAFSQTQNNQGGHSFQQTSFYSYQNTGNGAPKVIQSSSSERRAPGGVRETHKALKDSERNLEKMAIGRHIHDRGHVVERRKNTQTGDQEQNQEYLGIEEGDAEGFDTEWKQKTSQAMRGLDYDRRGDRRRQRGQPKALPPSRTDQSRTDHWRNDDDNTGRGDATGTENKRCYFTTQWVRETHKALKDSERNLEKMAIGRHIHDRGHVVERRKNTQTGDQEQNQEYLGIEEGDAEGFDTEWKQKTSQAMRGLDYDRRGDRRRQRGQPKALPPSRTDQSRTDHWRNDDDKTGRGRRYRDRE